MTGAPAAAAPGVVRRVLTAPRRWSVAGQTFALQVLVAVLVVVAGLAGAYLQASRYSTEEATAKVVAVAKSVASTPLVARAVQQPDPSRVLQPLAEHVRLRTGTDFVVIMSPRGVRYSHPNPAEIGKVFIGHIAPAAAGGQVVEDYTGTLGPSRRAVVPVSDHGRVVGLVSVGVRKAEVSATVRQQLPVLFAAGVAAALLCGLGTAVVARRVRRQTRGLGARELQEMYDYHDAVLHAVTDGLVLTDLEARIRVANDEAARLLGLPDDAAGRRADELGLPEPMVATLTDDAPRQDELQIAGGRALVVSKAVAVAGRRPLGYVVTLRDRTDLLALTGELDSARSLSEALRSQAHETSNRLHTIVSLIELGHAQRALAFATDELAQAQGLTDAVVGAVSGEPALTALLLGKSAQASERGVEFRIEPGSQWPEGIAPAADVVTIAGNLLDNAFEAVSQAPAPRRVTLDARVCDGSAVLTVSDNGPGLTGDVEQAFRRGYSTKAAGQAGRRGVGLALVAQSVTRLGGEIEVHGPPGARFVVRLPWGGGR
ncbi:MAG TPA: sensor histidine kinase [Segeticoccus sp.]|uniref:sensor histidine kinase n=1 Tax=Segeticoccus sp. TaxID=2706531 RepID=UPI002D7F9772|nr:sensor histidine kinase [Segeticoccus sp.]HET8600547.1 sensor histidine kinase [Segeticoccus sp.]